MLYLILFNDITWVNKDDIIEYHDSISSIAVYVLHGHEYRVFMTSVTGFFPLGVSELLSFPAKPVLISRCPDQWGVPLSLQ